MLAAIGMLLMAFNRLPSITPFVFPEMRFFPEMPLPDGYRISNEGVLLGKYLFYDTILSRNYTMSCGSCHHPDQAFSDAPHSFSKGVNATALRRNSLPLFNLAWYDGFFWDGRAASIEELVLHPVRDPDELGLSWPEAMQRINASRFYREQFRRVFGVSQADSLHVANAIGQFLRVLLSSGSKYDRVLRNELYFTDDEQEGFFLVNDMTKGDCVHCHPIDASPLGTTGLFSNNGLDDVTEAGFYKDYGLGAVRNSSGLNGHFKIPSLRNLGFTAPYMHDGRFRTLEEVIDFYSDGVHNSVNVDGSMMSARKGGAGYTADEKRKVIAFLHTLNDSAFVSNPLFRNPFR